MWIYYSTSITLSPDQINWHLSCMDTISQILRCPLKTSLTVIIILTFIHQNTDFTV